MKRGVLLIVALLLLAALGVGVLVLLPGKAGLPAGCQAALDQYLAYKNVSLAEGLSVKAEAKAAKPGSLTQDVSYAVYGDSTYYQTDENYKEASGQAEAPTIWTREEFRPLPYPPEEVWCILLERSAQTPGYGVAFVSLHQDIHNAGWVVHEAAPDPFVPESLQVASDLGCDLQAE